MPERLTNMLEHSKKIQNYLKNDLLHSEKDSFILRIFFSKKNIHWLSVEKVSLMQRHFFSIKEIFSTQRNGFFVPM